MEMEKRINSQEQEEDVIDLMEIARLVHFCLRQHTAQKPVFTLQAMSRSCLSQICS